MLFRGGLRGAVGIALAIHLDKHMDHQLFRTDPRRRFTTQLFGITGGVAFMTLVVNGTLSGPLLRHLGLAKTGEARQEVARTYHDVVAKKMFSYLLRLLGQPRFAHVDYAAVRKHVSWFEEFSPSDIRFLVKKNKETTPVLLYNEPCLESFEEFLEPEVFQDIRTIAKADRHKKLRSVFLLAGAVGVTEQERKDLRRYIHKKRAAKEDINRTVNTDSDEEAPGSGTGDETSEEDVEESVGEATAHLIELRKLYIDLLDKAYDQLFETGEVEVRNVNMVVTYKTSVEVSRDSVAKGNPIDDWKVVAQSMARREKWLKKLNLSNPNAPKRGVAGTSIKIKLDDESVANARDLVSVFSSGGVPVHFVSSHSNLVFITFLQIYYGTGFTEAHTRAQAAFKSTAAGHILSDEMITVLEESQAQVEAAEAAIALINKDRVQTILVHLVCQILLNKAGEWIGELNEQGMLKDQEAEHELESIQHDIDGIAQCHGEWVLLPCQGHDTTHHHSGHGSETSNSEKLETEKDELKRLLDMANAELRQLKEVNDDAVEKGNYEITDGTMRKSLRDSITV